MSDVAEDDVRRDRCANTSHRSTRRACLAVLCCWLALPLAVADAAGNAGTTLTPDLLALMANKDIGNERWTINLNLAEPASGSILSATGNVFRGVSDSPAFVYCELRSDSTGSLLDPASIFRFSCRGAPPCRDTPEECATNDWSLISDDVEVRADFFLPDAGLGDFAGGVAAGAGDRTLLARRVTRRATFLGLLARAHADWLLADFFVVNAQAAASPMRREPRRAFGVSSERGATLTPDRQIHLISKDVGMGRWSMAAAPVVSGGRTRVVLTGNVYKPDGSPPSFVYCLERLDSSGDLGDPSSFFRFSCEGASTCEATATDCAAHSWTSINDDLELGASFLLPPTPTPATPMPTVVITLGPTPQATPSSVITLGPTPQATPAPVITLGATPTPGFTPTPQPTPSQPFITLGPTATPPLPSATRGGPP